MADAAFSAGAAHGLAAGLERLSIKRILIAIFIICAGPTGLLMALLTPPGQVPDEPTHMTRIASIFTGQIIGQKFAATDVSTGQSYISSGVYENGSLFAASLGLISLVNGHAKVTASDRGAVSSIAWNRDRIPVSIPNTVRSFPALYLPGAVGLGIAYSLRLTPFHCVLAARLGSLAAFLAMGCAALTYAAFGESLILITLLLPMSLFLGASLNVDGQMIAASCLAASLLTTPANPRRHLIAVVLLALIALTKPPYFPLLAIPLLPLIPTGLQRRSAAVIAALVLVAGWTVLIAKTVVVPFNVPAYHPGPLFVGDHDATYRFTNEAGNLHVLLTRPIRLITLPLHSLRMLGSQNIREGIGVLGSLNVTFPNIFYHCWQLAFAFAVAGTFLALPLPSLPWRPLDTAFAALAIIATIFGIELSTYLSWTSLGSDVINGVTGRYFLPLLPFLAFVAPRFSLGGINPPLRIAAIIPVMLLGLFDSGALPFKLATFYYLY